MRASCWVQPETRKQSESKARLCRVFGEILSPGGVKAIGPGASPAHLMLTWLRWSLSAHAETRKMVNYAWTGRSQGKLWWRPVAILTCKSIV